MSLFARKDSIISSDEFKLCMNKIVEIHTDVQILRGKVEKLETDFRSLRARINKLQFDDEPEEEEPKSINSLNPFT